MGERGIIVVKKNVTFSDQCGMAKSLSMLLFYFVFIFFYFIPEHAFWYIFFLKLHIFMKFGTHVSHCSALYIAWKVTAGIGISYDKLL